MDIYVFFPKNKLLVPYIECFYVLSKTNKSEAIQYITFPSLNAILSVIRKAEIGYVKNNLSIRQNDSIGLVTSLTCNYRNPVIINYEGIINEITIYFKPLGINAFLEKDLCEYTKQDFGGFEPFSDFSESISHILDAEDIDKRICKMEEYWLTKLRGFEHSFLPAVVSEMINAKGNFNINDLANKYGVSRKTLHKHFLQHLCRTPSEFRKILRFRSLNKEFIHKKHKSLTAAAYDFNFCDQSHFIREFESLTGDIAPREFFKKLITYGNGEINWIYMKR